MPVLVVFDPVIVLFFWLLVPLFYLYICIHICVCVCVKQGVQSAQHICLRKSRIFVFSFINIIWYFILKTMHTEMHLDTYIYSFLNVYIERKWKTRLDFYIIIDWRCYFFQQKRNPKKQWFIWQILFKWSTTIMCLIHGGN